MNDGSQVNGEQNNAGQFFTGQMLNVALMVMGQLGDMKDKIDPEVYTLLAKSAHEAISSAHLFLDACEKAIDSIVEKEVDLNEETLDEDENVNVVTLAREA